MTAFPQTLYDIFNNYNEDLILSGTPSFNDLQTVADDMRSQQRVVRRLMTNAGDYIWHPTYGASLGKYVGMPLTQSLFDEINSVILSQIFQEQSVAQIPPPVITLQTIQNGLFCQINYFSNPSQQPIVLTFTVPG